MKLLKLTTLLCALLVITAIAWASLSGSPFMQSIPWIPGSIARWADQKAQSFTNPCCECHPIARHRPEALHRQRGKKRVSPKGKQINLETGIGKEGRKVKVAVRERMNRKQDSRRLDTFGRHLSNMHGTGGTASR